MQGSFLVNLSPQEIIYMCWPQLCQKMGAMPMMHILILVIECENSFCAGHKRCWPDSWIECSEGD